MKANSAQRVKFAVVGHPNKGKSSIVSTLSHNDVIAISSRSGTTDKADNYKVETANAGYELIDTPGFQRPNKVLAWLNSTAPTAAQRSQRIAEFVRDPDCAVQFRDEVALLTPIIQGAAILYVVDGSRPYDTEYDAEMEILRWTGQPSMALINPIESEQFVANWQQALGQYFKTVRVFNPMTADFNKQLELLQVFAHLQPSWSRELNQVVEDLQQQRVQQKHNVALLLSRLLQDMCSYQQRQKVLSESQAKEIQPLLANAYKTHMIEREERAIKELLANYAHFNLGMSMDKLTLPPDLFDFEHWYMWGLDKKQLATASAVAGAAAGAALDLAVAGHSLMLGALGGGVAGFASAWLGADKLVELRLKGLPLGGYEACYGPVKNRNFPYVIIGRFMHIYQQISQRNHASREQLTIQATDFQERVNQLQSDEKKALHQACDRLIKQKTVDDLSSILLAIL